MKKSRKVKTDEEKGFLVMMEPEGQTPQLVSGKWIRQLGKVEEFFVIYGRFRSINPCKAIWLSSDAPLKKETVNTALEILVQQIPILSLCVRMKGLHMWFKKMSKNNLDLEELSEPDVSKVMDTIIEKRYNASKGPLWCTKMVRMEPGFETPSGISAKHLTMFAFGVHHVITDSTSLMVLCKEFIKILNHLLKGENYNIDPYPFSRPYAEGMIKPQVSSLVKYSFTWIYEVLFSNYNKKTTFDGNFPIVKKFTEVKTRQKTHIFSEEITMKLIALCKKNGASVHSAVVTAINATYLSIVQKKSENKINSVKLNYVDSVNLRRYYPKHEREPIGCHVTVHEQSSQIGIEERKNFWQTAKASKKSLHEDLESKKCLELIPLMSGNIVLTAINYCRNKLKVENLTDRHYSTSNMGDVTKMLGETKEDDPVKLEDLFRMTSLRHIGLVFSFSFHTFRNRIHVTIIYSTSKLKEDQVTEFVEEFRKNISDIALLGNLECNIQETNDV